MQTFLSYMRSALPLLVVALVLGAATYFVAFAVLKKKGRGLPARWKLWLFVSSVYVFALVMLLIVRGEGFSLDGYGWYSLDLFHEYRTLARSFTANAFINILMNILIFLPFGFLFALPFGESKKRWLVIPLGVLATMCVELVQFVMRSGIADVDDLFNNTLGVICGYALARLCVNIRARRALTSVACAIVALACIAPPFAAWGISAASPYGVSDYETGGRAPLTGGIEFSAEAEEFLTSAPETYSYYTTPGGTLAEARERAAEFFALAGTSKDMEDLYDDSAYIRDEESKLVVYRYTGPEIKLSDSAVLNSGPAPGLGEDELRTLAAGWGVEIPEGAVLEELGEGMYRFTLDPTGSLGGTVTMHVREDGLEELEWGVYELTEAGRSARLTAAECTAALERGDYAGWIEEPSAPLIIVTAEIEYALDSKGVYRPMLRLDTQSGDSLYLDMPPA